MAGLGRLSTHFPVVAIEKGIAITALSNFDHHFGDNTISAILCFSYHLFRDVKFKDLDRIANKLKEDEC